MRARTRRRACLTAAASLGVALATSPLDMADASGRNVAVCAGTTTLTFVTHNLTAAGTPDAFSFSGGGMCTGVVSGPAAWAGNGVLQVIASCTDVLVLSGSGTLTGPSAMGPVVVDAAGPSAAQAWVFDQISAPQMVATAAFAWTNEAEISNCIGPFGTATMTLASVVSVAAP